MVLAEGETRALERAGHRLDVDGKADRRARPPVARQKIVVPAAAQNGVGRTGDEGLKTDAGVVVEPAHLAEIDVQAGVDAARLDGGDDAPRAHRAPA